MSITDLALIDFNAYIVDVLTPYGFPFSVVNYSIVGIGLFSIGVIIGYFTSYVGLSNFSMRS